MDKLAVSPLFGFGVTGVGFIDGMYFRVLGETGVLGLLTFLWLQFSVMLMTYRVIRKTNDSFTRAFAIGFLAGHVGLMFHGLGTSTHLIIRIQEPFWFLAALVVHLDLLETQQNTEDEITDAESPLTPQVFPRELARI
jgi:hypothetical protein